MPESVAVGRVSDTHPCLSTVDTAAGTGMTLKVPTMPITCTSTPKRCCCVRILCWKLLHKACQGSLGVSGQFQGACRFWVATGLGLKPHRVPPALPCTLTCKSSLGSLSAAARVALGSQWWIRDTWSQPGLPGATRRLTPAIGEEEKRKKLVFLGHAHDSASCCRRSEAGWACGTGSGVGAAALPASDPGAHIQTHRSQNHLVPSLFL